MRLIHDPALIHADGIMGIDKSVEARKVVANSGIGCFQHPVPIAFLDRAFALEAVHDFPSVTIAAVVQRGANRPGTSPRAQVQRIRPQRVVAGADDPIQVFAVSSQAQMCKLIMPLEGIILNLCDYPFLARFTIAYKPGLLARERRKWGELLLVKNG